MSTSGVSDTEAITGLVSTLVSRNGPARGRGKQEDRLRATYQTVDRAGSDGIDQIYSDMDEENRPDEGQHGEMVRTRCGLVRISPHESKVGGVKKTLDAERKMPGL
jgi:hypothetical protein